MGGGTGRGDSSRTRGRTVRRARGTSCSGELERERERGPGPRRSRRRRLGCRRRRTDGASAGLRPAGPWAGCSARFIGETGSRKAVTETLEKQVGRRRRRMGIGAQVLGAGSRADCGGRGVEPGGLVTAWEELAEGRVSPPPESHAAAAAAVVPCRPALCPDGRRRAGRRKAGTPQGQGWAQASSPAASGSLLQLKGQGVPSKARPDWHWRSASWQTGRHGGRTVPREVQWGTSSPHRSLRKLW